MRWRSALDRAFVMSMSLTRELICICESEILSFMQVPMAAY